MNSLLGAYDDSDDDAPAPHQAAAPAKPAAKAAAPKPSPASVKSSGGGAVGSTAPAPASQPDTNGRHGAACDCDDCNLLLMRFAASKMQTKGIRFKCKLCGTMANSKQLSQMHFQGAHGAELMAYKKQKEPRLFEAAPKNRADLFKAKQKASFKVEDVLGKRLPDEDKSFGGFAKKEAPEPAPCTTDEYQEQLQEDIITAAPWVNAQRPSNENATPEDLALDASIRDSQMKRFTTRNCLTVDPTTVRCKLCYKTFGSAVHTQRHIMQAHQDDFGKEAKMWERFLFTVCKRQPPFGWICKVCNLFFPDDGAVWRHVGKEVYVRREERHMGSWQDREDRWGHEEDAECCGDGMTIAQGLSYDSVQQFNEMQKRQEDEAEAGHFDRDAKRARRDGKAESDSEEEKEATDLGEVKTITEF
eukprot:TRINITY_DN31664_c0_g1_i1.p2 TRINITY_DN31664_c0_g1~~TRINITY_DN31664_c0_g1_i1.p2  ORF type:complete len:416 (+),score=158.73 TRINITY_DN31664_c0_g1_i1:131-1378(+)